jgi:putative heme transporter
MTGTSGGKGATAKRWRRITIVVILAAGLAAIIITNEHILLESLHTLAHLNWWWVLAALAAEAISLTAFGISRVILLRAEGDQATLGTVMSITYAGNALSMAVPFAGAQLAAVFSYRQLRGRGLGPAITSWALAVSAIVSSAALALVLLVGAFAAGQPGATLAGLIGAAVFLVPGVTVLLALRYRAARAWIHRTLAVLLRPLHRRWGKSWMDPAALEELLDRVASISLPGTQYALVFALALVNWLADCACLACSILATGRPVPWNGLLLAYGAGAAVGSSGLSPGGFALVEIALTAALTAAGMTASAALAASIAYRLISFWLILIGGGVSLIVLARRPTTVVAEDTPPPPSQPAAQSPDPG